jgi:hypothetical protein
LLKPNFQRMKKILIYLSFMAFAFLLFACKKDKEESTTPITYPNFSEFKTGSYWIYQRFTVDSTGNVTPTNIFDSCFVEKDTLINNRQYIKTIRPNPVLPYMGITLTRDSLHYIVNSTGAIVFSSMDFQTIFSSVYKIFDPDDTICQIISKMADKDLPFVTPAGTFTTMDFRLTYLMYPAWSYAGNPRYVHTRYAENIGIVSETFTFFASNPNYTERRLVRFHLN